MSLAERIPPFWMVARDLEGREVDPRVTTVAEDLWPQAYRHVARELRDPAIAAQLIEGVALDVSRRLREEPGVGRNLSAYFATAFRNRVRQQVQKERRMRYEGLVRELESNYRLTGPDWVAALDRDLCLEMIIDQLPEEPRHMLNERILGFSWKEIGQMLGISGKQASSRFYHALEKLHAKLIGSRKGGAGQSDEGD